MTLEKRLKKAVLLGTFFGVWVFAFDTVRSRLNV